MTATERTLRAGIAGHSSRAHTADRGARTAKGRATFNERFEREVDPDGVLTPAEGAENARRAYFAGRQLKSARAHRQRAAAKVVVR